jgi:hypothetical protein
MLVGRNRVWIGLAGLAALALGGPGCDSTQPTDASGGQGNATVVFTATTDVKVDDVYDFFVDANHCADTCVSDDQCTQTTFHRCVAGGFCAVPCTQTSDCLFGQTCDVTAGICRPVSPTACDASTPCFGTQTCVNDQDGVPDDVNFDDVPDVFQVCVPTGALRTASVPINYWVDIKKVPAGTTTQEQVSDPAFYNAPIANTGFSTNPIELGVSPPRPAFDSNTFHVYTNPRRMDESRSELMVLPALQEGDFGVPFIGIEAATGSRAYCPFGITFPPPPTFTTELQAGDTLLVKARKLTPLTVSFGPAEPVLTARVLLNGVEQVPTTGTASAVAPGADLSFSFTVR